MNLYEASTYQCTNCGAVFSGLALGISDEKTLDLWYEGATCHLCKRIAVLEAALQKEVTAQAEVIRLEQVVKALQYLAYTDGLSLKELNNLKKEKRETAAREREIRHEQWESGKDCFE